MLQNLLDPVVIFFLMGVFSRLLKVSLSIHQSIYETISIYLLLAIGLKGGYELNQMERFSFFTPVLATVIMGMAVPCLVFFVVSKIQSFSRDDTIAMAAHYGAASAVTFAVVINYLEDNGLAHENFWTILLILLEVTGILTAFCFLHLRSQSLMASLKKIFHDVLLNKSIFLLLMGIVIGWISSVKGFGHVKILFIDLFKGILCFFMLEMGLVCGQQFQKVKENQRFILLFGIGMPFVCSCVAICIGKWMALSVEGTTILATISASASYIAAPAVTRSVLPRANLSIPLACALGVTFPFNVLIGIPVYYSLAKTLFFG